MRRGQTDAIHVTEAAIPPDSKASVFVFVASPEEALASFERQLEAIGAKSQAEVVAVPVYPSREYFEAFMEENRRDVRCIAIDLREPEQANALIETAVRIAPNALILATDDGQRADALLPALRAGAKDVISPPYDMQAALRTLNLEPRARRGGNLAFFLPAQGGNGASTAAIHFAACIASDLGEKEPAPLKPSPVLLLDLDFHSDSTAFWLNKRPAYTLVDALHGASRSPSYWRKITTPWNGIDLLAPPPPDSYVSEELLGGLPNVIAAATSTYSWVVVDLPPTLFASSRRLLPRGDKVFLVCTPEARSLYLARRRLADLKALGISPDTIQVTLNRAGAKRSIEAQTAEKSIGARVSFSIDNDYVEISSAYSDRRLAAPQSTPGKQFKAMARVAMGVQDPVTEKLSGWRRLVGFA